MNKIVYVPNRNSNFVPHYFRSRSAVLSIRKKELIIFIREWIKNRDSRHKAETLYKIFSVNFVANKSIFIKEFTKLRKKIGQLYLITDEKFVKIGESCDPEKRLRQLQTGNSAKLRLLKTIKFEDKRAAQKNEKMLHRHFRDKRIQGEWFLLNADDIYSIYLIDFARN